MNRRLFFPVLFCLLVLLASQSRAVRWELTASQLASLRYFHIPAGDTLRVSKDQFLDEIKLDWIDWPQNGRLELSHITVRESAAREDAFPFVLNSGQELDLDQSRVETQSAAFILNGGGLSASETVMSSTALVIELDHPESVLTLNSTRFGASGTAVKLNGGTAELHNCVFLTNDVGMDIIDAEQLVIQDCLFQGNDVGMEIRESMVPVLINVDIIDSRYWDVINHHPTIPVDLSDVYLSTGNTTKVQGLFTATTMPQTARHSTFDARSPLLIPQDVVVGEVPLSFEPVGETTQYSIPCRESRFRIFISDHPFQFSTEPDFVTTDANYQLVISAEQKQFVRITAELGRWQD